MVRLAFLASALLSLVALTSGCDDKKGAGKTSAGADNLVRAPSQVLPQTVAGAKTSQEILAASKMGGLKDAVAGMTNPATSSKVSNAVFDGNRRDGDVDGQGDGVYAGNGGGAKTVNYTGPLKQASFKSGDVPKPDTLPAVELPQSQASATSKGGGPVLLAFEAFQKKLYDAVYPVYSRLAWNASPAKRGEVKHVVHRVTIHHTQGAATTGVSDTLAAVKNTQHYHQVGRAAEGKDTWDDIGYHFLMDREGRVIEGRHTDALGAHAGGANSGNVGIAMMGDYNKLSPTQPQKDSLKRLAVFLAVKYRIDPRQPGFLEPHKHFNNTDCPGKNMIAFLPLLRQWVQQETMTDLVKLGANFTPVSVVTPAA